MIGNRSAPECTVVPVLIYDDVATALDWLCGAFGFEERLRAPGRDGRIVHAQLVVGDGAIMLGQAGAEYSVPHPGVVHQYVHVRVPDVDPHHEHASASGARIIQPPTNMPFGERQYVAEDPAGHRWTFTESVADVAPEEWGARVADGG